jgi:hypothetical protein
MVKPTPPITGTTLVINFDQTTQGWYAAIGDTTNIFNFLPLQGTNPGLTASEIVQQQLASVKIMGSLMQGNDTAALTNNLGKILDCPSVMKPTEVMGILFDETDALVAPGVTKAFAASSVGADALLEAMVPAGEFLLDALLAC